MKKLNIVFIFVTLFMSCTYEKGGITDALKTQLVSFEYETLNNDGTTPTPDGQVEATRHNGVLTLTFITEETGCPLFEGGYKMMNQTLYLYYQDIDFQAAKCIDLFKFEYQINDEALNYQTIEVVRLKPIKKGLRLKN